MTKRLILLLIAATFATYWPVLHFDFVNYDDPVNLERLRDAPFLSEPLLDKIWTEPHLGHYQPLVPTAWWTIASLARQPVALGSDQLGANFKGAAPGVVGLNAIYFHAASLLVHTTNGVLVFLLLGLFGITELAAFLGSLIFAFHPAQVESVAWVSAFGGLFCSFFFLCCAICFVRFGQLKKKDRKYRFYFASLGFFLAALLCKSLALVFPGIAIIISYAFFRKTLAKSIADALPFALLGALFISPLSAMQVDSHLPFWVPEPQRFWIALDSIRFYLGRIFTVSLGPLDYGRSPDWVLTQNGARAQLSLFLVWISLGTSLACWTAWHWKPKAWNKGYFKVLLCAGWFFLPLVPVTGLIPFLPQLFSTVADRYLYLSTFAIAAAAAFIVDGFSSRIHKLVLLALIVCLSFGLSFRARQQLFIWKDSITLYESTIRLNPRSWLAYNNLASYYEMRRSPMMIQNYLKSAEINFRVDPVLRVATMQAEMNQFDDAKINFERVLQAEPRNPLALNNLGMCYYLTGNKGKARSLIMETLQVIPNMPEALSLLRQIDGR